MLRRRVDAFMTERLLCLPDVPRGELRADEAPEVVRLDVAEADLIGIALHRTPHI